MKLTAAHIKNFKSINDSGKFRLDEKVTCLVGKNESGKTAILQALAKLNAAESHHGTLDLLEYPRYAVSEYKERHASSPDVAVVGCFALSDHEHAELVKVVGDKAAFREFSVEKSYNNERSYDFSVNEAEVIQHLLTSFALTNEEREPLATSTLEQLEATLGTVKEPAKRQKELAEHLRATFAGKSLDAFIVTFLDGRMPKIAIFHEYVRMPGQLSLDDLKVRLPNNQPATPLRDSDRVFLALLDMVGRKPEDLEKSSKFEDLQGELEGVSNRLTREIFTYWSQNRHLRVQFRFEQGMGGDPAPFNKGWVLRTRIENTRHGVTTSFDDRSAGFVWFFSFLVWFHQIRKKYGENFILLLDEPGLTLHARAQADLLRYFEERLAPKHQLIYTTHSPFMVDAKNLLRARTVEDRWVEPKEGASPPNEVELGTKVGDEVLSTDRDTLFPLQGALGYEITQTLFVGAHTLLVEGPSDILYLKAFSEQLRGANRVSLDPRWTISPCGGVEKVSAFISLFGGSNVHVAVLIDFVRGMKKKVEDLRRAGLLRDRHVLTADTYAGQSEADIEDLLGRDGYSTLVNATYGLAAPQAVTVPPPSLPERILQVVEPHFRTLLPPVPEFDHYQPSEYLFTHRSQFLAGMPGIGDALNRFERLFKDLNALL